MNNLKKHWPILLISLLEIIIGIVLLIQPVGFTNIAIIITGVLLAVRGILYTVRYVRSDEKAAVKEQSLAKGLTLVAAGLFCMLDSAWLLNTFSVLSVLYGVAILVMGFFKLQRAIDMLRAQSGQWLWAVGSAALALIIGAIILWNPFRSSNGLWIFTGICLLAEALVDLVFVALRSMKDKTAA